MSSPLCSSSSRTSNGHRSNQKTAQDKEKHDVDPIRFSPPRSARETDEMEKWSFQRTRELMTPRALRGMAVNEVGRARISMMVRSMSSNSRPDTLVQDRTPQPHRFLLQRTAGPYIALSDYPPLKCRCRSRARASLRNRHQGPSIMGFEDEVEQSMQRPCQTKRQVQADMRTHLIHRPARDIIPPLGGARVSFYWI